jgi:protein SCO1/2
MQPMPLEIVMSQEARAARARRPRANEVASFVFLLLVITVFMMVMMAMALPYIIASPSAGGGSFRLVGDQGQIVTDRSWPGKFLLVYFGYTHCPDICPTMLATIAGALNALGAKGDRIQPLFVTLDPQRDTEAVMKQYTALFSPRIAGLTGTTTALAEAAQDYGVHYARQQTGPAPGDYEMEHSAYAYLVTPGGQVALTLPPGQSSQQMASELAAGLRDNNGHP